MEPDGEMGLQEGQGGSAALVCTLPPPQKGVEEAKELAEHSCSSRGFHKRIVLLQGQWR